MNCVIYKSRENGGLNRGCVSRLSLAGGAHAAGLFSGRNVEKSQRNLRKS